MTALTARMSIPYPQPSDPVAGPSQMQSIAAQVDSLAAIDQSGTHANRLTIAPSISGRYYFETDTGLLYRDSGTAWNAISGGTAQVVSAKGDLIVGSGPGALARLGVGSDGQVLVARSTATDGVDWEANNAVSLTGPAAMTTYTETLNVIASAGATPSIDLSIAQEHRMTLSANVTGISIINVPTGTKRISFGLAVVQPASGGPYTVTWGGSVDWGAAGAPTLSTAASKTDFFGFVTDDGGTVWYGFATPGGF